MQQELIVRCLFGTRIVRIEDVVYETTLHDNGEVAELNVTISARVIDDGIACGELSVTAVSHGEAVNALARLVGDCDEWPPSVE